MSLPRTSPRSSLPMPWATPTARSLSCSRQRTCRQDTPLVDAIPPRYSEEGIDRIFDVFGEEATKQATAECFLFIARAWQLTETEAAALLGVRASDLASGLQPSQLNREHVKRVASLIGIYRALHLFFSQAVADGWVKRENSDPTFGGQQPVQMMIRGGLPKVKLTLDYVDGLRG